MLRVLRLPSRGLSPTAEKSVIKESLSRKDFAPKLSLQLTK